MPRCKQSAVGLDPRRSTWLSRGNPYTLHGLVQIPGDAHRHVSNESPGVSRAGATAVLVSVQTRATYFSLRRSCFLAVAGQNSHVNDKDLEEEEEEADMKKAKRRAGGIARKQVRTGQTKRRVLDFFPDRAQRSVICGCCASLTSSSPGSRDYGRLSPSPRSRYSLRC